MFSTTTMASSTTKPIAIVSAIRDKLLRLKLSMYIAPNEPSSASGIVIPGIMVAQRLRKNRRTTRITIPIVSTSVNSTSCTEARITSVRSKMVNRHGWGKVRREPRQPSLDLIDRIDHVCAGLLRNIQYNAELVILVTGKVPVRCLGDRLTDIAHPYRTAISIRKDDVVEKLRVEDLVVGSDRESDLSGIEHAFRRCRCGADYGRPDLFECQAQRSKPRRVNLNPDGRPAVAAYLGLSDAGHLSDLLGQKAVEIFVDPSQR